MTVSSKLVHYTAFVPGYEDASTACGALVCADDSPKVYEVTCRSCLQHLVDDGEVAKLVLAKLSQDRPFQAQTREPSVNLERMDSLLKEHYGEGIF